MAVVQMVLVILATDTRDRFKNERVDQGGDTGIHFFSVDNTPGNLTRAFPELLADRTNDGEV